MQRAQQLGRYQLLDRIAYGGMAEIFRAKTFDADGQVHLVAIKRVLPYLLEDDELLAMIAEEARISALLHHENIAELYEFAHAGHEYFLAMEYVDGKDLRAVMERVRSLGEVIPVEHAAWAVMETAKALHAAHNQRDRDGQQLHIVHRDVSPSNVLCGYRGEVKLCDFGIAKATLTSIQTRTGIIKGKVKYMSPEQAMGRKLDHRSDLFSLGTVLYETLALQAPFSGRSEESLIHAVRQARKRPVAAHRSDVPAALAAILDRATERYRGGRYASGAEMAGDLRAFLDRNHPGYGRGHFAGYMRRIFQPEIERELREIEEYVLDAGDASQVGENLIADALAADAPFTRFTPEAYRAAAATGPSRLDLAGERGAAAEPAALHETPTLLIDRQRRERLGLPERAKEPVTAPTGAPEDERNLSERSTARRLRSGFLAGAPAGDEGEEDAAAEGARRLRSIHEESTGRKGLARREGDAGTSGPAPSRFDPAAPGEGGGRRS